MGLQAIIHTLHRQGDLRVDIGYEGNSPQLEISKDGCSEHFEIYPPLGIALITENIAQSRRCAKETVKALPINPYGRDLLSMLTGWESEREETLWFRKYSSDTRSLNRFFQVYFSFVNPSPKML